MAGWIKLNRSLQKHWLYTDKPFCRTMAWVDLIIQANHAGKKFLLGADLVTVERGTFITSEVKLMERWGWSKSKVRKFLDVLESDEMLIKKSDSKKTTLTLCQYRDYQDRETTEEPIKDYQETAEELPGDTNKNTKEYKEGEEGPAPEISNLKTAESSAIMNFESIQERMLNDNWITQVAAAKLWQPNSFRKHVKDWLQLKKLAGTYANFPLGKQMEFCIRDYKPTQQEQPQVYTRDPNRKYV